MSEPIVLPEPAWTARERRHHERVDRFVAPAGRASYVRAQQGISDRAAPLRATLVDTCDQLLAEVNRESASAARSD